MITSEGFRLSIASKLSSSLDVQSNWIFEQSTFNLKALSLICSADSSPLMYKTVWFSLLILAKDDALCKSSVDFPIPGSPPSKIAERFVAPPPTTLSNSSIPVENLTLFSVLIDSENLS